jgi:undecaprenyl-diphosphatase
MPKHTGEKAVEKSKELAKQAVKTETAAPPKRKYRTLLFRAALFSAIGAFAVLTFMVITIPSFAFDLQITRSLQSINSPLFAAIMSMISWPGFSPQSFIISALIVLVIYSFGWQWEALTALLAALLPPLVNILVKELIRRPRPTIDLVRVFGILDSYSFPSGHVMFYVGFFGFIWFLAFALLKRSPGRTLVLVILGSMVALIGISRIYLGQHWASDVLGAYLLGSILLMGIIQFYRWGRKRFFVHQQAVAQDSAWE